MTGVEFEGQTKTKLGNPEVKAPVEQAVMEGLNSLLAVKGNKPIYLKKKVKRIQRMCIPSWSASESIITFLYLVLSTSNERLKPAPIAETRVFISSFCNDTTMNPATRNLIQVTIDDAAEAAEVIEMLMGDKGRVRLQASGAY